jgi:hypothetical protein
MYGFTIIRMSTSKNILVSGSGIVAGLNKSQDRIERISA